MQSPTVLVQSDRLHEFIATIFRAVGFSDDHAEIEADVLVWANLRGVDSHGIFRIPNYIRAIKSGDINPKPNLHVAHSQGASCIVEADRAPGPVTMTFAIDQAIAVAGEHAVGWALVRNTTHTGPMGYYARRAAERGMIGIVSSASRPIMAYHGTRVPTVSTNPIAISVPQADGMPLSLDMATAAIAWGKLTQARQLGGELPDNVALDSSGRVTTDASQAALPLPVAGAKGAGLSLMIECMTSLLAGLPLVAPALTEKGTPHSVWQHGLAIAVDIAAFTDVENFAANAKELAAAIREQPLAEGTDEVLMPGERGDRVLAERKENGIPIIQGQWQALIEVAASVGVEPPDGLTGPG
jgi:ureidoglycolate dehydrogenase (NAD+)